MKILQWLTVKQKRRLRWFPVLSVLSLWIMGCSNDDDNPGSEPQYRTDIYVCGSEFNGSHDVAKYWKNGEGIELSDGTPSANAHDITVSDSTLYVHGAEKHDGSYRVAKYWKNSTAVPLSDSSSPAEAYSIFVDGKDVYVAGREK